METFKEQQIINAAQRLGLPLEESTEINAMNAFAVFQLNYPHNFISEAFNGWMVDHLQNKFNHMYSGYGPAGAIIMFWAELDRENRNTLMGYVINLKLK